jgi:hypothetical protein
MNKLAAAVLAVAVGSLILAPGVAEAKQNKATITPLDPVANAVITQNDPATGCADNPTAGFGFMIAFDWASSKQLTGNKSYTLTIQRSGSLPSALEGLTTTSYLDTECSTFVTDANLTNWTWTVCVVNGKGRILAVSQPMPFRFAPCRLSGGAACSSP